MSLQALKVEIEETASVLDLAPFARAVGLKAKAMTKARRMARRLALAIELEGRRRRRAQRMVRALGQALGLIAERQEREPIRVAYASELRRREKLDRNRARQLRDGEDAADLTAADLKVLAAADRLEAKAAQVQPVKGKPATKVRTEAGRMRTLVAKDRINRTEARRADLRLAQTVDLDAAREGEPADQVLTSKRGEKQRRLRTRDGLKLLHERGGLAPKGDDGKARRDASARIEADRLLAIGLRYRDRYEMAQASLRSCLAVADNPPPSPNLFVQCRAAQRRAALANQVRVLDVAVATRLGSDALLALRMVAGEARTIRSLTASSRRREALTALLPAALAVVGDALGAAP